MSIQIRAFPQAIQVLLIQPFLGRASFWVQNSLLLSLAVSVPNFIMNDVFDG